VNVVKKQLDFSSIILLVFDFTQLNSEASEKEKRYGSSGFEGINV
jgi:hypothetical protein